MIRGGRLIPIALFSAGLVFAGQSAASAADCSTLLSVCLPSVSVTIPLPLPAPAPVPPTVTAPAPATHVQLLPEPVAPAVVIPAAPPAYSPEAQPPPAASNEYTPTFTITPAVPPLDEQTHSAAAVPPETAAPTSTPLPTFVKHAPQATEFLGTVVREFPDVPVIFGLLFAVAVIWLTERTDPQSLKRIRRKH